MGGVIQGENPSLSSTQRVGNKNYLRSLATALKGHIQTDPANPMALVTAEAIIECLKALQLEDEAERVALNHGLGPGGEVR